MNKSAKIIVFALSLALLIGAAIGFSASAETTAPEIVSKNIAVDGNFSLVFAVDPATVAGDDVTVTIYAKAPAEGVQALQTITKAKTDTTNIDRDGDGEKEYSAILFYSKGVSAKDIADVWYITTTSGGVTSEPITYSVREYAFERLYKNGTIFATAEDEDPYHYEQQQFYLEILDVGSAAQELLVNYGKAEAEKEKLAREYIYAAVVGGTYTIGETTLEHGFVSNGDVLTLTSTDESVKAWDVYTFGQNGGLNSTQTVAAGDTVTVEGNIVAVPYEIGVTAGKYFDEIGNPIYTMDNLNWKNFYGNDAANTPPEKWYFGHTNFSKNSCAYLLQDSGFEKHGAIVGGTKPSVESGATGTQALLHFPIYKTTSNEANCVVFEYDFYYNGADVYYNNESDTDSGTVYFIMSSNDLSTATGAGFGSLSKTLYKIVQTIDLDGVKTYDETSTKYKSAKGENALRLPGVTDSKHDLDANTWYRITYEVYTDVDTCLVYVNGVCVGSFATATGKTVADYNTASLMFDARYRNVEFYVDNVCGAKICKEYKAP